MLQSIYTVTFEDKINYIPIEYNNKINKYNNKIQM